MPASPAHEHFIVCSSGALLLSSFKRGARPRATRRSRRCAPSCNRYAVAAWCGVTSGVFGEPEPGSEWVRKPIDRPGSRPGPAAHALARLARCVRTSASSGSGRNWPSGANTSDGGRPRRRGPRSRRSSGARSAIGAMPGTGSATIHCKQASFRQLWQKSCKVISTRLWCQLKSAKLTNAVSA